MAKTDANSSISVAENASADAGAGVPSTMARDFCRVMRRLWRGVREWCGDAAYERYLCSQARAFAKLQRGGVDGTARNNVASSVPLSAKDFYVEQLDRRYSNPSRCC